jgi:hypothetical protein
MIEKDIDRLLLEIESNCEQLKKLSDNKPKAGRIIHLVPAQNTHIAQPIRSNASK